MDGLDLRTTAFDDPDAASLVTELMADLSERYGGPDTAPAPDPRQFEPPEGTFRVAWVDGAAVACGGVRRLDDGIAEIKRMYVAPAARGWGVARALLAALEEAARGLGYREVWLETGLEQPEAMALYESSGYEPISPYGHYAASERSRAYGKKLV